MYWTYILTSNHHDMIDWYLKHAIFRLSRITQSKSILHTKHVASASLLACDKPVFLQLLYSWNTFNSFINMSTHFDFRWDHVIIIIKSFSETNAYVQCCMCVKTFNWFFLFFFQVCSAVKHILIFENLVTFLFFKIYTIMKWLNV